MAASFPVSRWWPLNTWIVYLYVRIYFYEAAAGIFCTIVFYSSTNLDRRRHACIVNVDFIVCLFILSPVLFLVFDILK